MNGLRSRRWAAFRTLCLTVATLGLVQACSRTDVVTVAVNSVTINPSTLTMAIGETRAFDASVRDDEGTPLPSSLVVWSSSDPATLSVTPEGSVQALRAGAAQVWAAARDVRAMANVTVQTGPVILSATSNVELFAPLGVGGVDPFDVTIENGGSGPLTGLSAAIHYGNSQPTGWLAVALSSTTAPAVLRLTASTGSLSQGSYSASVIVESPVAEGSLEIQVALSVTEDRPILRLSPPAVSFAASSGSAAPAPRVVTVSNIGGGELTDVTSTVIYQALAGWLSATLSSSSAPAELTLTADPSNLDPGTYRATVRVGSPVAANESGEVAVTFTVDTEPEADLSITKSSSGSAILGDTAVFVLTVQNAGPRDALNVSLVDSLPDGLAFAGASSGGSVEGAAVRWSLGTVVAGATVVDTLKARVGEVGTTLNVARVSTSTPDPVSGNDRDIHNLRVEPVPTDLGVEKRGPAIADVGDTIRYAIVFFNLGPAAASNVVVTDSIPPDVTVLRTTNGGVVTGREVRWTLSLMPPGISRVDSVIVTVDNTGELTDVASISSDAGDPETGNNRAVVTTTTEAADLRLSKTGPSSGVAGAEMEYVLTVVNDGPSFARNVVVEDTLPRGATFVSASGDGTHSGGIVTWPPVNILSPTLSLDYQVVVRIPPSASGEFRNAARVESTVTDPDLANNWDQTFAGVGGDADLAITKSGPKNALAGTNLTYAIVVDHVGGPSDAQGVVVTDALPPTLTFVSSTGGGTYDGASRTVSWDLGAIPAGGSVGLQLVVTTGRGVNGNVTNTARVTSESNDVAPSNDQSSVTTAVVRQADLAITKTAPPTVVAGTSFIYTIEVEHVGGPSNSLGVVVTDVLPTALTYVSSTGGGTYDDDTRTVTWNLPNIVVGGDDTVELEVALAANAAGSLSNTATVSTTSIDPVPGNNASTVTRTLTGLADLAVSKSGPPTALAGENIEYEVSVRNNGPSLASNVVLIDSIPAGTGFVSASEGGGHAKGQVTWPTIGSLGAGQERSYKVVVSLPPNASGSVTNVAKATSATSDPDLTDNRTTVSTAIGQAADIRVTKTGPDVVTAGTNAVYVVRVFNDGPSTATGVVVIDSIPAGTGYVGATGGGTHSGGQVTWPTIASLAPGASQTFALAVSVMGEASGTITNVAKAGSATPDPDPADNRATASTTVTPSSDLRMTKTGPASVHAGTEALYTVTVFNDGPSIATDVVVIDSIPAGTTFVGATSGGVHSGGQVTWPAIASLASGASASATVTVAVASNATGTITNVTKGSATTGDPNPDNNRATASTNITRSADLRVTKTGPGAASSGANHVYTITVDNVGGPSDATGVVVTDILPESLTFVSGSGGASYNNGQRRVRWVLGALPLGGSSQVTLTVMTDPSFNGTVANTAAVTSTSSDPSNANNQSTAMVSVTPSADLEVVEMTGAPGVVIAGSDTDLVYTMLIRNNGPSNGEGVTVADVLPSDVTFVSATEGGTHEGGTVSWTLGTLEPGETVELELSVTVDAGRGLGLMNNASSVSTTTSDPTPGNDGGNAATLIISGL